MEQPTVVKPNSASEKVLNIVLPYNLMMNSFEENSVAWAPAVYPNLYTEGMLAKLNSMAGVVGYLFIRVTIEKAKTSYRGLGSCFLLSPTIAATTMHQVNNIINYRKENVDAQLYLTTFHDKINANTFGALLGDNDPRIVEVKNIFSDDVLPYRGKALLDPLFKRPANTGVGKDFIGPDFCLFELLTPIASPKYFVPHPKAKAAGLEVYVIGTPGVIGPDYVAERSYLKGFTAIELNSHINLGVTKMVSPGHLLKGRSRDDANKYAVVYDCYTQPGNSGSPVVTHCSPDVFIGVHYGGSTYPGANICVSACHEAFARSYVRRVLPTLPDTLQPDQVSTIYAFLRSVRKELLDDNSLKVIVLAFKTRFEVTHEEADEGEEDENEVAKEDKPGVIHEKKDDKDKGPVKAVAKKSKRSQRLALRQLRINAQKLKPPRRAAALSSADPYDFDESTLPELILEDVEVTESDILLEVNELSPEEEEQLIAQQEAREKSSLA